MVIAGLAAAILGLLSGLILFFHRPLLEDLAEGKGRPTVSVIIPARNEGANLAFLLKDLRKQTYEPLEVIVVDDNSTDRTSQIALEAKAKLLAIKEKPEGWTGKNYACHLGAKAASGELLLFLDADVRLSEQALEKLVGTWQRSYGVVSVQPYHRKRRFYESFSVFFNLIQVAANGLANLFPRQAVSLFGPVILLAKTDYEKCGGHASVKACVVEDLALAGQLKTQGIPFRLFLGGRDISFRMYGQGLKNLAQGWIKNFATGAGKTRLLTLLLIILWVACFLSLPFDLVRVSLFFDPVYLTIYASLMVGLLLELAVFSSRLGNQVALAVLGYPLWMAGFLVLFLVSLYRRAFRRPVTWKGRKIGFQ
jgi:4,4'-diaponeurosporenoate glycosyltransferase